MTSESPHTAVGSAVRHSDQGEDLRSGLARIAARARSQTGEKFNSLLHHLTPELIGECLQKMSRSSAPGIDGLSVEQVRQHLEWMLQEPLNRIHKGSYEAPPVRRVYIPKADGRQRPIGIPTVLDRGIQAGMARVLERIYEQDFQKCSFGFRPGLGCHHALATIHEAVNRWGMNIALEVDIRDFFGSLDHSWLRRFLEHRIGDDRVLKLIDVWLRAGVMEEGQVKETEKGTPQGGSISPLLANIYLHYVLDLWFERVVKRQLRGKAQLVRYCDDFVILFQDRKDAEDVMALLMVRLGQFGLSIAEEKTHVTDLTPRRNRGEDRRRMTFLGFSIYKTRKRNGSGYRLTFKTEGKRFSRAKQEMKRVLFRMMHREVKEQARRINALLRGHFGYYGLAGNGEQLQRFRYAVVRYWKRCLSRRNQRGGVNWEKMQSILAGFPIVPARLCLPYARLGLYAVL